jgi:UDP-glucose 4-epimerase
VDLGQEVVVLDNMKRGSRERLDDLLRAGDVELVEGDIRTPRTVRRAAKDCDVIYHLAAQSNVMGAIDDPEYSFTTNAYGTFNVLRNAAELGVGRVVFTSSREVYGEPQYTPVDEDHPLAAKNPYGASKLTGEAYCRTFAHCNGLDVAVVRLANVYGPGDTDRVIPIWLEEAMAGRDLHVFGGNQILDFVWIDTVVDALLYAGEHGLASPTNIGSGVGTTILELGCRILEIVGANSSLVRKASRNAEVTRFVADISRMKALGLRVEAPLAHLAEVAARHAAVVAA